MDKKPIRVLVIDDDEEDFFLTRDMLAGVDRKQFQLDWQATYEAGLDCILQGQHDAYLIDYRLGARSGLELLREAIAKGSRAPMILLTGQGDHEVDLEAMRAGAADYV